MLLLVEKKSSFQPDSEGEILWKSLQESLKANKRGIDGKIRILSIIAENFTYKKLKEKFKVKPFYHQFPISSSSPTFNSFSSQIFNFFFVTNLQFFFVTNLQFLLRHQFFFVTSPISNFFVITNH